MPSLEGPSSFPIVFQGYKEVPGPSSLGAKWFRYRVSIHHPLGFNWHPLEGAGINMSAGYIIAKARILLVASNIERIATSPSISWKMMQHHILYI